MPSTLAREAPPPSRPTPAALADEALRPLGAFVIAVACFWTVVLAYVIHPALPFNPIHLPLEEVLNAASVAPEGWAFFTRNPREPRLLMYRQTGGRWVNASLGPNGLPRNLFGIGRAARAQGAEAGLLSSALPGAAWRPCSRLPAACLASLAPAADLRNPSGRPSLCGIVGFARQAPVPWAWAQSDEQVVMPSQVLAVRVRC
ncbi:MAG: hypothetical protein JWM27_4110 [Gemmatimonadetes bacterium]|nr:hypothetical protein [Gemmatimonadota bacterium]